MGFQSKAQWGYTWLNRDGGTSWRTGLNADKFDSEVGVQEMRRQPKG